MEIVRLIDIQEGDFDLPELYRDSLTKELRKSLEIEFLIDNGNIHIPEKYLVRKKIDENELDFLKKITKYILSLVYAYRGIQFGNNIWERKEGFKTRLFSMDNKYYRNKAIIGSINFLKLESQKPQKGYLSTWIQDLNSQLDSPLKAEEEILKGVNWLGTQTELMELIKGLILSGKVKGTQREIIQQISLFFQKEINNPDKLLQDIKNRNNGSETLFLDHLKGSLLDFIKK